MFAKSRIFFIRIFGHILQLQLELPSISTPSHTYKSTNASVKPMYVHCSCIANSHLIPDVQYCGIASVSRPTNKGNYVHTACFSGVTVNCIQVVDHFVRL